MSQRFTKFASPFISLILLFSVAAGTPSARAADSFVYTDWLNEAKTISSLVPDEEAGFDPGVINVWPF